MEKAKGKTEREENCKGIGTTATATVLLLTLTTNISPREAKMSTPSPPSSPPSDSNPNSAASPPSIQQTTVVALAAASASASASVAAKKPQPVLWTHDETLLLLDAYKEKWFSLGRGQLKASHWEEIAAAVSARSGVDRSATQCRHKIEKMRKRFRAERQRVGPTSVWPYYALMEELESRPTPISARPLTRLPPNVDYNEQDDEEDDDGHEDKDEDEEEEEEEDGKSSKSRSINYILRRPSTVNRFAGNAAAAATEEELLYWGYGERRKKKRKVVDEEGERRRRTRVVAEEIRGFAERLMIMEKRKMEFLRETERRRMEMEMKRLQLIQSSHDRLLHFITTAFASF